MNKFVVIIFVVVVAVTINCNCSNILVLEPVPSRSHHIWIRALTTELAQRGHNITTVTQDVDADQTENLHYINLEKVYPAFYNSDSDDNITALGQLFPWKSLITFNDLLIRTCIGTLESNGLQQLLAYPDDFKFDLVLHDYMAHPCLLGFLHKFKYPPLIGISAFNAPSKTLDLVGSQMYLYMPNILRTDTGLKTDFFNRVESFLMHMFDYGIKYYYTYPKMNELARAVYPDAPNMTDLIKQTKLVLINSHPVVETPEPIMPNVIPIGGMQIARPKPLPDDIQLLADGAKKGLILFSLGTNVHGKSLGDARIRHILEAFRNLPSYVFLWKIDANDVKGEIPANVHMRPWIPQIEILSHKNTLLFISHCGLLSMQESVFFGIPMLAIPIAGDQFMNAQIAIRAGIAETLSLGNVTAFTLRESILKVSRNLKYRIKAKQRMEFFRDQPQLPINRAIWWVERVIRNPELQFFESPAKHLNYFANHGYDAIAFLIIILFIQIVVLIKLIKLAINFFIKHYRLRRELQFKYMKSL